MKTLGVCVSLSLLLACSKKQVDDAPKPEPKVSALPRSTASAPLKKPTPRSHFSFVKRFSGSARLYAVGSAAIVCEAGCRFSKGPAPKVWRVDAEGVVEDKKLWPGHAWQDRIKSMKEEGYDSLEVTFSGKYPKPLYAFAHTGSRTGEVLQDVSFQGKYWASVSDFAPGSDSSVGAPPRRYDDALLTAPVSSDPTALLVFGAGGETLIATPRKLHVYKTQRWSTRSCSLGQRRPCVAFGERRDPGYSR